MLIGMLVHCSQIVHRTIFTFYIISDVDECSQSVSVCHQHAECTNTIGSYSCQCKQGFLGDGTQNCAGACYLKGTRRTSVRIIKAIFASYLFYMCT